MPTHTTLHAMVVQIGEDILLKWRVIKSLWEDMKTVFSSCHSVWIHGILSGMNFLRRVTNLCIFSFQTLTPPTTITAPRGDARKGKEGKMFQQKCLRWVFLSLFLPLCLKRWCNFLKSLLFFLFLFFFPDQDFMTDVCRTWKPFPGSHQETTGCFEQRLNQMGWSGFQWGEFPLRSNTTNSGDSYWSTELCAGRVLIWCTVGGRTHTVTHLCPCLLPFQAFPGLSRPFQARVRPPRCRFKVHVNVMHVDQFGLVHLGEVILY